MRLKVDTPKTVNLKIFSENRLTKNIFLEPLETSHLDHVTSYELAHSKKTVRA